MGLTWDIAAEETVSAVWQAFTDRGVENVIAVSDVEAAEALARGIADIAGCERLVVCVAEPGSSLIATVTPDGVTADRVDAAALTDVGALAPDVVFVLGSGDVSGVMAALEQEIEAPILRPTKPTWRWRAVRRSRRRRRCRSWMRTTLRWLAGLPRPRRWPRCWPRRW